MKPFEILTPKPRYCIFFHSFTFIGWKRCFALEYWGELLCEYCVGVIGKWGEYPDTNSCVSFLSVVIVRTIVTCWWSAPSLAEQSYSISFIASRISMWMWRILYFITLYSISRFLNFSITRFLNYSISQLLDYSISRLLYKSLFSTTLTTRTTTAAFTTLAKAAIFTSSNRFSTVEHSFASATRKKNTPKISPMPTTTTNASNFSRLSLLLRPNLKSIEFS